MNASQKSIGFDRKVRLSWLDATAEWAASDMPLEVIRSKLDLLLEGEVTGKEAIKKTKTILLRTWVLVPDPLRPLRDHGLVLAARGAGIRERLPLHWGMAMPAYPLLWETANVVGRLLGLQGEVTLAQIRRRIAETYGERSTVARATQRITRTLIEWNVLEENGERGVYVAGPVTVLEDDELVGWLVEATLHANGASSGSLPTLVKSPALFPFRLGVTHKLTLERNPRLEIYRQGLDEDLVTLRPAELPT